MEQETGNLPKKMKLSSPDPFIVLEKKVFELIFQHFSFENVKVSSTVSTLWFKTTGRSNKCMERLNLLIKYPNLASPAHSTLSCLFMDSFKITKPKLMAGRAWKKVHLDASCYERTDLFDIKKQIAQSVKRLTISNYPRKSSHNEEPEPQLSFPNLKVLRASFADGLLFTEISQQCKNLKTLEVFSTIGCTQKIIMNQDFVYTIMEANNHLEEITLNIGYLMFIPGAVQRLQFKLKKLKYKGMPEDPHISFYEFVQSQAASLEYLSLSIGFSIEIVELVFTMEKLRHLDFDIRFLTLHDNWDYVKLGQRPSIVEFRLTSCSDNYEQNRLAKKLVRAMPNLRSLYCSNLNDELMKSISLSCPTVEKLEVPNFNVDEVEPLCFPSIKKFKCSNFIPTNLVERIKAKSAEQRSAFERLLLLENISAFNRTFRNFQNQAIYY